jgi:hypothetical protein
MKKYIVAIAEIPGRPEVARELRSTLRNYFADQIMGNLYAVHMTKAQQVTLHQVADRIGGELRYMDAPEPPRYAPPRRVPSVASRPRRLVPVA